MSGAYQMTYDNLFQDVINYMERNDDQFVAQIPSLIGLAESAIAAESIAKPNSCCALNTAIQSLRS